MVVPGCTEHWCMHCHDIRSLETENGDIISPHGHVFTDENPLIDELGLHCARNFSFLVVSNELASLRINNSKFSNWRWL